jgi:hypothetical protein
MSVPSTIGLATLLGLVAPAVAAGGVSSVTLSPASPVAVGTTVTVTVTGSNPCGLVRIEFGDGDIIQSQTGNGLPFSRTHEYPAGTFTISVKGLGACTGQATATLVVTARDPAASADTLCKVVHCPGLPGAVAPMIPRITKVLGLIQPGGTVLVGGDAFGDKPGRVRMIAEDGSQEFLLQNLEWYPSGIGGRIPNVPGVGVAKNPRFVVETSAGKVSNEWGVNWIVDVKVLPIDDVKLVSCSTEGWRNRCNLQSFNTGSPCGAGLIGDAPSPPASASIQGRHNNCWGAVGDDVGQDVYQIDLRNGWALHELVFGWAASDAGEGSATGPAGFTPGSTTWKPQFKWSVTPADEVAYWAYVFIRGPKGVPHK